MKQVFKVYINGKFTQYLLKSELRLLSNPFTVGMKITLECVEISLADYKTFFGK